MLRRRVLGLRQPVAVVQLERPHRTYVEHAPRPARATRAVAWENGARRITLGRRQRFAKYRRQPRVRRCEDPSLARIPDGNRFRLEPFIAPVVATAVAMNQPCLSAGHDPRSKRATSHWRAGSPPCCYDAPRTHATPWQAHQEYAVHCFNLPSRASQVRRIARRSPRVPPQARCVSAVDEAHRRSQSVGWPQRVRVRCVEGPTGHRSHL